MTLISAADAALAARQATSSASRRRVDFGMAPLPGDKTTRIRSRQASIVREAPGTARGIRTPDPIITNDRELNFRGVLPDPVSSATDGFSRRAAISAGRAGATRLPMMQGEQPARHQPHDGAPARPQ